MTEIAKLLHVHTAAKILNCSKNHVYHLIEQEKLESVRIGERALRVLEPSLKKFLEGRKVDPFV